MELKEFYLRESELREKNTYIPRIINVLMQMTCTYGRDKFCNKYQ